MCASRSCCPLCHPFHRRFLLSRIYSRRSCIMTSIISSEKVRCKNCHKCIRSCPVKSIQFKDDQAQIMPEECILCGACLEVCPRKCEDCSQRYLLKSVDT
ncbi:MAG: 4Fe-4S dicluster domain-containing protein [Clostridia bacterium]